VCPAGIDIRDGQQLECITCALCIDACDSVMDKVGSPKGLISYSTLKTYNAHKAGGLAVIGWRSFLRPRTFVYTAIWVAVGLVMLFSLLQRERLDVSVLNDRNPLYVKLSDGSIRNGFTIKILNMEQRPRSFVVSAEGLLGSTMTMTGGNGEPLREFTVDVEADKLAPLKSMFRPRSCSSEQTPVFKVVEQGTASTPDTRSYAAIFHAPPMETTP
jgi:polyferredoxin